MIRDQVRYPAMRISMEWCPGVNRKVEGVFPTKLPSITISAPSGVLPNSTDDGATATSVAASEDGGQEPQGPRRAHSAEPAQGPPGPLPAPPQSHRRY